MAPRMWLQRRAVGLPPETLCLRDLREGASLASVSRQLNT